MARARCRAGVAFVLLAIAGTLAGHTLVWTLVGGASPALSAARSVHTYIGPLGAALALLAAVASWTVWRAFAALDVAAARLRRALRRPGAAPPTLAGAADRSAGGSWSTVLSRPGTLALALLAVQLCVYTVQENLEARVAHVAMPGLVVLTSHHGTPIALHAAVAVILASSATLVWALWMHRRRSVERIARLVAALAARRGIQRTPSLTCAERAAPRDRFGLSFASRAPPFVVG